MKSNWFLRVSDGQLPDITVRIPPTGQHLFSQIVVLQEELKCQQVGILYVLIV